MAIDLGVRSKNGMNQEKGSENGNCFIDKV